MHTDIGTSLAHGLRSARLMLFKTFVDLSFLVKHIDVRETLKIGDLLKEPWCSSLDEGNESLIDLS